MKWVGRRFGTTNLSEKQIQTIIKLTRKGEARPKIAKAAGCGNTTVYNWQKRLNLI